jgi:hypothetical protein
LKDSRFAYTEIYKIDDVDVPVNFGTTENLVNGYGYIRSPWNQNPSKHLQRTSYFFYMMQNYLTLPECKNFNSDFSKSDLTGLSKDVFTGGHGNVHVITGGQWSSGDPIRFQELLGINITHSAIILVQKLLYR